MLRKNNPDVFKIELYNLKSDIGETNDVAADHPAIVKQMERTMRDARTPSEMYKFAPLDALAN